MDRNEFMTQAARDIREFLPPEALQGLEITESTVIKMNDQMLRGLTFRRDKAPAAPTIYLNDAYERYLDGEPMGVLLTEVADAYMHSLDVPDPGQIDLDFDKIRDHLTVRLVEAARNREFLSEVPFMTVGNGLALVCNIKMQAGQDIWRATVTRDMMRLNGYDRKELFASAMQSCASVDPPVLTDMEAALFSGKAGNYLNRVEPLDPDEKQVMYILTNDTGNLGAAALFYPGMQARVAEILNEGYTVLPSSIHEVLIVPDSAGIEADHLRQMVREANRLVVQDKDVLSGEVYHYDPEARSLSMVKERDARAVEAGRF